jgi:hypothetical protein
VRGLIAEKAYNDTCFAKVLTAMKNKDIALKLNVIVPEMGW